MPVPAIFTFSGYTWTFDTFSWKQKPCIFLTGMSNFLEGWNSDSDFEDADQTGEEESCSFVTFPFSICPSKSLRCTCQQVATNVLTIDTNVVLKATLGEGVVGEGRW